MAFEKVKFKEIINGEEVTYMINDKIVDKETYDKLSSDDSLYVLPSLPKMNDSPENNCNHNMNDNMENNQYDYESNQELLAIINDIREMDDNEALEGLRNYLEAVRAETRLLTLSEAYNELGNSMIKVSARLEDQLYSENEGI